MNSWDEAGYIAWPLFEESGIPEPMIWEGKKGEPSKPQFPMFYDLSGDPHEDNNLIYTDKTNGWMAAPVFKLIGEYQHSIQQYPNIKVGEEFKGYQKTVAKSA